MRVDGSRSRTRIPSLDVLRAFAILWVILRHMQGGGYFDDLPLAFLNKFFIAGDAGVDLFFILSGYLIATIVIKELNETSGLDVGHFWYRRWMRTLPAYYVTLLALSLSDLIYQAKGSWSPRWSYLVFLQTSLIDFESMRFGWSWSLCVQELFYLFLPLLVLPLYRISKHRSLLVLRIIAIASIIVSFVGRTLLMSDGMMGGHSPGYGIPYCRLDGIAIGMMVATFKPMRSAVCSTMMGLTALTLLGSYIWTEQPYWFQVQRFLPLSILFGAILYASVSNCPWREWTPIGATSIAALSYSLYLVHPVLASVVAKTCSNMEPAMKSFVFIASSFVAAILLRYLVELPFLWLRDRQRKVI